MGTGQGKYLFGGDVDTRSHFQMGVGSVSSLGKVPLLLFGAQTTVFALNCYALLHGSACSSFSAFERDVTENFLVEEGAEQTFTVITGDNDLALAGHGFGDLKLRHLELPFTDHFQR